MSENTQNQNPQQEQYSLNDDRRVKVLSPGALVAKRFFRNRLAVVGLSILIAMFLFSFVGGLVSPYGQDEQFFTYTQMSKEFVGVTRNDAFCRGRRPELRFHRPEQGPRSREEGQHRVQL